MLGLRGSRSLPWEERLGRMERNRRLGVKGWVGLGAVLVLVGVFYWTSPGEQLRLLDPTIAAHYPLRLESENLWKPVGISSVSREKRRVAICLVGGLRAFELTGPSIKKYLLDVYEDADVFVNAPVDADVHKLTVLNGVPRLASVRLFMPETLNETDFYTELLSNFGSPHGIQGLLQYFTLVEGCVRLIEDYETVRGFKYDWVIRTRVDGYWNGPMPPIEDFNASTYYVPYGSDFGGLNDRLGVGTRATSWVALSRLSLLSKVYEFGARGLNSERAFQAQFTSSNVTVQLSRFPFCVLSVRQYGWPLGSGNVPVASMLGKGALNGAKCRPCTPKLAGREALKALNLSDQTGRGMGPTEDPRLCDARKEWEQGWEKIYEEAAGSEMAAVRQRFSGRSVAECIEDVHLLQQQCGIWDAPAAEVLCDVPKSGG